MKALLVLGIFSMLSLEIAAGNDGYDDYPNSYNNYEENYSLEDSNENESDDNNNRWDEFNAELGLERDKLPDVVIYRESSDGQIKEEDIDFGTVKEDRVRDIPRDRIKKCYEVKRTLNFGVNSGPTLYPMQYDEIFCRTTGQKHHRDETIQSVTCSGADDGCYQQYSQIHIFQQDGSCWKHHNATRVRSGCKCRAKRHEIVQ